MNSNILARINGFSSFVKPIEKFAFPALLLLTCATTLFFVYPGQYIAALTPTVNGAVIILASFTALLVAVILLCISKSYLVLERSITLAVGAIMLATAISAIFALSHSGIWYGYAFEPTTLLSLITFFVVLCIAGLAVGETSNTRLVATSLLSIFLSFVLLATFLPLWQVLPVELIGVVTDTKLLFCAFILTLVATYVSDNNNFSLFWKGLALVALVLSLFIISQLADLRHLLIFFTVMALYVYFKLTFQPLSAPGYRSPLVTLLVFAIVLFLLLFSAQLQGNFFQHLSSERQPTFSETFQLVSNAFATDVKVALIGMGPANFEKAWMSYRPSEVNESAYWNDEFKIAPTFLLTILIEYGIIGLAVFGYFLLTVFMVAFRTLREHMLLQRSPETHLLFSLGILAVLLLAFGKLDSIALFLSALCLGLLLGYLQLIKVKKHHYSTFTTLFGALLIAVAIGTSMYYTVNHTRAIVLYEKSIIAATLANEIEAAQSLVQQAIEKKQASLFYRSLVQLHLRQVDSLLTMEGEVTDVDRENLSLFITLAKRNIDTATKIDPHHYLNWYLAAEIDSIMTLLGVSEAAEEAKEAYLAAHHLAPNSALIYFSRAELAFLTGDITEVKGHLRRSLTLKPDYEEARSLLNYVWQQE